MDYTTKEFDICIEGGADFYCEFALEDNSGNAIDLTGTTITAHLREFPEASDYYEFTASHTGTSGNIMLTLDHDQTGAIGFTMGVYDVFVTYADGTQEKVLYGNAEIIHSVTKLSDTGILHLRVIQSEDYLAAEGKLNYLYYSLATGKVYQWTGSEYVERILETDISAYTGSYIITPTTETQTLDTTDKMMEDDVTVEEVSYAEVSNTSGGYTATIL